MDIAIVGRHTKVTEQMRARIEDRIAKLAVLAPRATRADVHVCHERNPKIGADRERVEITLHGRNVMRSEASAVDREAALELAVARLTEQLRRMHERKAHRHQGKPGLRAVPVMAPAPMGDDAQERVQDVQSWEGAPEGSTREVPIDGTPIVIRSKTHEAAPMTVPEAIDQMELVGHDFFMFHDIDSDLPSAVYRRRGWTYGVLHLEASQAQGERESA
jgi:ribosomal subunit interface protein